MRRLKELTEEELRDLEERGIQPIESKEVRIEELVPGTRRYHEAVRLRAPENSNSYVVTKEGSRTDYSGLWTTDRVNNTVRVDYYGE